MDVYRNTPDYSFNGLDSRSADNQRTPLAASAAHQQQFQSALQTPSFTQDFLQNLIQQLVSQILNALSNQNSPQNQPQNQTPSPEPTTPSTDTGDALNLTSEQTKSLENYFDKGTSYYDGQVIDKDGSGTISAGDIAKLRQVSFASSSQYDYTLTQNDADIIHNNAPEPLNLSDQQQGRIANRFNEISNSPAGPIVTEYTGVTTDRNGDGQLSAGDTARLSSHGGIFAEPHVFEQELTAEDINQIQNTTPSDLNQTRD